jgi:hypothetical protein
LIAIAECGGQHIALQQQMWFSAGANLILFYFARSICSNFPCFFLQLLYIGTFAFLDVTAQQATHDKVNKMPVRAASH